MTDHLSSSRPHALRRLATLIAAAAALAALAVLGTGVALFGQGAPVSSVGPQAALQALVLDAPAAANGDAAALDQLAATLKALERSASEARLREVLQAARSLVGARATLIDAANSRREVRTLVPQLLSQLELLGGSVPPASADAVTRLLERAEVRARRIESDVEALASGGGDAARAGQRLAESSDYLSQVVLGLAGRDATLNAPRLTAGEAALRLGTAENSLRSLQAAVRRAVAAAPSLPGAQRQAALIVREGSALIAGGAGAGRASSVPWWPAIPALLALIPLFLGYRQLLGLRREAEQQRLAAAMQRSQTDRGQEAILRLLDELSSLADGDLTVQATVTEDMTGAIADSINYAVEALRGLVTTINGSAIQLDGAAKQTTALAQHLAKASNAQSKQIGAATESVAEMAAFTEEVSGNAERAADVARHSVDVAHKGGDAVRRTIDGMNTIRETIQETSKRIKRLGESSQEIGNIVELINDIAEQTNILALNASIQASMAGDAGRGFAVVADEVQRLAERAANATKQIEVLVRTIQADTNEAVVSMERSTTDVVGGALLAENAGAALGEIEQVSNQIASLVQNISGSARQQATVAQNIARNMQILKEISLQTADSTSATTISIAKLAELSTQLRTSVAGFRLPETPAPASPPVVLAARRAGAAKPAAPVAGVGDAAAG